MNGDWLIVAAMVGATVAWGVLHRERPVAPRSDWATDVYGRDYKNYYGEAPSQHNTAPVLPTGTATVTSPHLPFWTMAVTSGLIQIDRSTTIEAHGCKVYPSPINGPGVFICDGKPGSYIKSQTSEERLTPVIMPAPVVEDLPVHEVCTTRETVMQIAQLASRQGKTTSVGQVLADGRICISIM